MRLPHKTAKLRRFIFPISWLPAYRQAGTPSAILRDILWRLITWFMRFLR